MDQGVLCLESGDSPFSSMSLLSLIAGMVHPGLYADQEMFLWGSTIELFY